MASFDLCHGMPLLGFVRLATAEADVAAIGEELAGQKGLAGSAPSDTAGVVASWACGMVLELLCFVAAFAFIKHFAPKRGRQIGKKVAKQSHLPADGPSASQRPPALQRQLVDPRRLLEELRAADVVMPESVSRAVDACIGAKSFAAQVESAALAERILVDRGVLPSQSTCEKLLMFLAKAENGTGVELVRGMAHAGYELSEGFCRHAMYRCAESHNWNLAETLAAELKHFSALSLPTFKMMMKVYACVGRFDKACDLYSEMASAGVELDAVTYGNLMKFAVKAGRSSMAQELLEKSEGTGCIKTYLWTIRRAGQDGDLAKAIATFRQFQEEKPHVIDGMAYNIILDACSSNKNMTVAREFFDEMAGRGIKRNQVTFNTMIKGFSIVGDVTKIKEMMREMEASGCVPDSASFSCLLGCAAKALDFDEVWAILKDMDARGLPTDSYVVTIMMHAARRTDCVSAAWKALSILDRPTVRICEDAIVFNTVLDACIYRRHLKYLDRALREFSSTSSNVEPTARTWGLLIKACATLGRTEQAMEMWSDMLAREVSPNSVTLGCVIDALVEGRRVDEALALFQEWKGRVKCDTITYSTLIKGFAAINDADRAMALFGDMKALGVQLNHVVYTAVITACSRSGQMKRADAVLADMVADGIKPNAITYSVLIRGYCVRGDLKAALELFQRMIRLGFPADCIIFNTLLDGCVQSANWELAETLLKEMKEQGIEQSNFTISIVVKMWSKRGNLNKAVETVYDALKLPHSFPERVGKRLQGPNVDAHVGSGLIGACIHNADPERAMVIFKDMKTWANFDGPDANAYGAMICGLAKHGYSREAARIAEEACTTLRSKYDKQSLHPSALRQLYRALRNEGLLKDVGMPLSHKLREAGMPYEERWVQAS
eukprot:CAMPEP_0176036924 /NCGR_PEP_ID=MMETSP0120_2-20121206/18289_1 /TAXON_ID=160619 /ORGANISM="Kryptoperidinium foliaceum, Strain CCMP 1326" /LENGTH=894 /DNA_ID=CAMNT_0017370311 /DNA_START=132 /DNA_END=2816 /DNA_ORIENTATION=+